MSCEKLNVIALISGGKDSFFSLLHCIQHGHRVVALANLFPAFASESEQDEQKAQVIDPSNSPVADLKLEDPGFESKPDTDLNSFMYQTVGHEIIPLYAAATGLPLYRQPIHGGAERHERDYAFETAGNEKAPDETESMTSLLQAVMKSHPEANAVSAGAILSTYQRTRVESVALRLGLTPLAYLWKYPILPSPSQPVDDAQLLKDMAAAGLEARIIKVASAGLVEDHMWENVATSTGADRVKAALRRFGASGGAVLGEGGEFETVVLDGPAGFFRKKITVPHDARRVVQEGGGSSWLAIRGAMLEDKDGASEKFCVRTPSLWDAKFQDILDALSVTPGPSQDIAEYQCLSSSQLLKNIVTRTIDSGSLVHWNVVADQTADRSSVESETAYVVQKIRDLLLAHSLEPHHISNTVIVLQNMADFPKINTLYGKLFTKPNPPARVTVSCGDLLPSGRRIAIYLTTQTGLQPDQDRSGLHVQSRSYWAPANIGPYSQAIGILTDPKFGGQGPRSWSIAGQIPLIPSLMNLPDPGPTSQQTQIALSLQHLWRIGSELKIQFWTSAAAFFSRTDSDDKMREKAALAGIAWRLAHGTPDGDDDDEGDNGPDPWDLKYNPQFMSLGADDQKDSNAALPDWSVLTLRHQNEPSTGIPPVFAVEVEELPRQSAVEWHAHIGLSCLDESSVEVLQDGQLGVVGWSAWHTIVRTTNGAFLHTTLARLSGKNGEGSSYDNVGKELAIAYFASLENLKIEKPSSIPDPYLTYLDGIRLSFSWGGHTSPAVVPCRSLWSAKQERLDVLGLYKMVLIS